MGFLARRRKKKLMKRRRAELAALRQSQRKARSRKVKRSRGRKLILLKQQPIYRQIEYPVTIAVANQKGGVGKTTTSLNMASILAYMGHPVLIVDMDSQGHSTSGLGIDKARLRYTIFDLLIGEATTEEVLLRTKIEGLDIIPTNMNLSRANMELVNYTDRELKLREALDPIRDKYDFIFIDTPPSLGLLTINSLAAADSIVIPLQCEYFALEGVKDLKGIVKVVSEHLNPDLTVDGILITLFESTNLSKEIADLVRSHIDETVFKTVVPRDPRVAEAPSKGIPLILYDKKCPGAQAYIRACRELRKMHGA